MVEAQGAVGRVHPRDVKGLLGDVLLSDRNRIDLRDIAGEFSWRYRNRLSVEKEFSIGRVRVNPYTRFEVYYDSRYDLRSRREAEWRHREWLRHEELRREEWRRQQWRREHWHHDRGWDGRR